MESNTIFERNPSNVDLYTYRANVVRCVDGDSVILDIDWGGKNWTRGERCRLASIDTPEVRGEEKAEGKQAKAELERILNEEGHDVIIRTEKDRKGRYGRWIVTLWTKGSVHSINKRLLDSGHASLF